MQMVRVPPRLPTRPGRWTAPGRWRTDHRLVSVRVARTRGFAVKAVPCVAVAPTRRVRGVEFTVQRTVLARADLATVAGFPEASYMVECDGRQWHTIATDHAADVTRQGALRADGCDVTRITAADLSDRPETTVASIRGARQARINAAWGARRIGIPCGRVGASVRYARDEDVPARGGDVGARRVPHGGTVNRCRGRLT